MRRAEQTKKASRGDLLPHQGGIAAREGWRCAGGSCRRRDDGIFARDRVSTGGRFARSPPNDR